MPHTPEYRRAGSRQPSRGRSRVAVELLCCGARKAISTRSSRDQSSTPARRSQTQQHRDAPYAGIAALVAALPRSARPHQSLASRRRRAETTARARKRAVRVTTTARRGNEWTDMAAPGDRVVVVSNRMWCTRRTEAAAVANQLAREDLLKMRSSLRGHVFTLQPPPPGGLPGHVYLRIEASVLVPVPVDEVRPAPSRARSRVPAGAMPRDASRHCRSTCAVVQRLARAVLHRS